MSRRLVSLLRSVQDQLVDELNIDSYMYDSGAIEGGRRPLPNSACAINATSLNAIYAQPPPGFVNAQPLATCAMSAHHHGDDRKRIDDVPLRLIRRIGDGQGWEIREQQRSEYAVLVLSY